ncbi:SGNH hydrolase-type esterase domain-containing protein [Lactarius quietus]|nr:SGNH hydrolase-type esterase domain-containing protein [Lactarius quietus]
MTYLGTHCRTSSAHCSRTGAAMATRYQDTIVLFGDSLTQMSWNPELGGIGARVAGAPSLFDVWLVIDLSLSRRSVCRKLDVLNRGYSGYNTDWALPIIVKREFSPHAACVRLLTIWFGANDACLPDFPQHVPISRFSENLATMVRAILEPESPCYSPETRVLLITPPPIHIPSMRADLQPTRTFDTTESYAEEVRKVGKKEGVPDKEAVKAFFTDGLHLNEAGYKPENLRSVFPPWDYFHSHTVEAFESGELVGHEKSSRGINDGL